MSTYLRATVTMDFDHQLVQDFVVEHCPANLNARDKAISLYYAVRDQIRYDPYISSEDLADYSASFTLDAARGWCVPKAILYAACLRATGIPARLGYADVKNHMTTENLRRSMGTDIFYWHGYTDVYLEQKWVKATPAFNIQLCEKFRLKPLEFDGLEDSIYHPFDVDGKRHMEYLNYRGTFSDLPLDQMLSDFARYYPDHSEAGEQGDFEKEAELENQI
jgi:transglutaminase-like putative cysteine protease